MSEEPQLDHEVAEREGAAPSTGEEGTAAEEAAEEDPPPAVTIKRGRVVFRKLHDVERTAVPVHWKRQASRLYRVDEPIRLFEFVLGHHGFRQTKRDPNWSLWWTRGGCIRASMLAGLEPWQKVARPPLDSLLIIVRPEPSPRSVLYS